LLAPPSPCCIPHRCVSCHFRNRGPLGRERLGKRRAPIFRDTGLMASLLLFPLPSSFEPPVWSDRLYYMEFDFIIPGGRSSRSVPVFQILSSSRDFPGHYLPGYPKSSSSWNLIVRVNYGFFLVFLRPEAFSRWPGLFFVGVSPSFPPPRFLPHFFVPTVAFPKFLGPQ